MKLSFLLLYLIPLNKTVCQSAHKLVFCEILYRNSVIS